MLCIKLFRALRFWFENVLFYIKIEPDPKKVRNGNYPRLQINDTASFLKFFGIQRGGKLRSYLASLQQESRKSLINFPHQLI